MRGAHLLGLLILYSAALSADEIKLYACERKGETTLESVRSNDCDKLTEYRYTRQKENANKASNIRPEEQRQLEAIEQSQPSAATEIRRYENVDSRVGWVRPKIMMTPPMTNVHSILRSSIVCMP